MSNAKNDQHLIPSPSQRTSYNSFYTGISLILLSIIGMILIFPIIILNAIIGLFIGVIAAAFQPAFKDYLILKGPYIVSLGLFFVFEWGLKLTLKKGTEDTTKTPSVDEAPISETINTPLELKSLGDCLSSDVNDLDLKVVALNSNSPLEIKYLADYISPDVNDLALVTLNQTPTFFPNKKLSISEDEKELINNVFPNLPKQFKKFVLNDIVRVGLIPIEHKSLPFSTPPNVKEAYLVKLKDIMKNRLLHENEFWDRFNQLNERALELYVGQLKISKEHGKHTLSELDYLWKQFSFVSFQHSVHENKKAKLALILSILSPEQLTATFHSSEFFKLLKQEDYVAVTANTLSSSQFVSLALESKQHELMNTMVTKLKPDDPQLITKLITLLPQATFHSHNALEQQITHLDNEKYSVRFKLKLVNLAKYYVDFNFKKEEEQYHSVTSNFISGH